VGHTWEGVAEGAAGRAGVLTVALAVAVMEEWVVAALAMGAMVGAGRTAQPTPAALQPAD
jgi:hypothetical protein